MSAAPSAVGAPGVGVPADPRVDRHEVETEWSALAVARPPTVGAVTRQCSRTGCSETAAVTLTYQYAQSQVWLDDLTSEREPHGYDMCDRHAERLTAPQGWQVRDRRTPSQPTLIAV